MITACGCDVKKKRHFTMFGMFSGILSKAYLLLHRRSKHSDNKELKTTL